MGRDSCRSIKRYALVSDLPHSCIYNVVASPDGRMIAAATFKDHVTVIDAQTFKVISAFPITFGFGGKRIAIGSRRPFIFSGHYGRSGLGAYDYRSGEEQWWLKPVAQLQHVACDKHSPFVFVTSEAGPALLVDESTGRVADKLNGCKDIYPSPYAPWYLIESGRHFTVHQPLGIVRFKIKPDSFAILRAAFSPELLAVSEASGGVRFFDLELGIETGRYQPPPGSHVLDLEWCEPLKEFILVEWPYEKGGDRVLKRFHLGTNETSTLMTMPESTDSTFIVGGTNVFTSEGDVIDVVAAQVRSAVRFPRAQKS